MRKIKLTFMDSGFLYTGAFLRQVRLYIHVYYACQNKSVFAEKKAVQKFTIKSVFD